MKTTKEIISLENGAAEIRLRHTVLVDSEDLNRLKDLSIWFNDRNRYHKVIYRVGKNKDTNTKRLAEFILNRGANLHIIYKDKNKLNLRKENLSFVPLKFLRRESSKRPKNIGVFA